MEVELDKIGVPWRPSIRWVQTFLSKLGLSYKRAGGCLLKEPAPDAKLDLQQNLQQKVLCTQHKFGIEDARVINEDETSPRMIPVSATGWSVKGEDEAGAGQENKHNRNPGSPYGARAFILPAHLWRKKPVQLFHTDQLSTTSI